MPFGSSSHISLQRLLAVLALLLALSACGSDAEVVSDAATDAAASDDDHGDEDEHGDEDHDDEDEHGDEDDDHGDDHDDEGASGLSAHEHGSAEVSVVLIGSEVAVDLYSPTQNVFGFEYEAETDEDLAIVADRTDAITANGMLSLTDSAGCDQVESPTTKVEREGSHSELVVFWSFTCENPDDLKEIDFSGLFEEFPSFEDVDVEWVSEAAQSAAELSPGEPILTLES